MDGGSYLVTRKIRMMIETWDRTSLAEQEMIIGRGKGSGAPLGKAGEFDPLDFAAKGADGEPLIAAAAHVRLAHPDQNGGVRMLRRGYNFVDGSDGLGRLDAGLFSWRTSGIRVASSCRSSAISRDRTCSTSTSGTLVAVSSPARPECVAPTTSGGGHSSLDNDRSSDPALPKREQGHLPFSDMSG
jgi:hypothetical protein